METKLNETETGLDDLGLLALDENEAMETDGGDGHWVMMDGDLVWVND